MEYNIMSEETMPTGHIKIQYETTCPDGYHYESTIMFGPNATDTWRGILDVHVQKMWDFHKVEQ